MDADRFKRIQALFHEAVELPESSRAAFLEAASAGDKTLIADVLGMLSEDARPTPLLDAGLAGVADRLVGERGAALDVQEFGPYRLKHVLGEGGMGVVYLAERKDLGSQVAIKFLRDAWMSPARRERFASEQRTLARLNHPSIARLYDADTLSDGTPWFVMEYVEGVPITDYCRKHNCPARERLRLFRSVCEAVQYAHEQAIIHRDLKPSNILVQPEGTIRLLDFGIAKHLADLEETRTELRLMTPAYAAPEQIRGQVVGVFTDVYALGLILYELLTGLPAFDFSGMASGEAERIILAREPERPSQAAAKSAGNAAIAATKAAWADLDVLCLTAVHKDPQRRYRSAEALIRDIDHYLNGEPLEARPDSLRYRAGKFVARNRRAVSAAVLVFATVSALSAYFTSRLAAARNDAVAAAVRTQRVQRFMLNLFGGADRSAGPAENLRVVTLLDRGVQEAKALQQEPEVQAELYATLGGIYQKLGNFAQADVLLRSAFERRKSLLRADDPAIAESLVALGLLRVDQARLDEAERLVGEGLDRAAHVRPRDVTALAKGTRALGSVFEARGAYEKAIAEEEQAVKLLSPSGPGPDLAASLKQLADSHFYAGHLDLCDSLTQRAMSMHRQFFGDRHPLVADDLINLGAVQQERGRYAEAEKYIRQALEINQAWYGNEHPEVASEMATLARALHFEERYDEAVDLLKQALAIQERVYGPMHPKICSVINELGSVALQRGNLDEAEAQFRRMVEIYRAAYGDHHDRVALALANLASVYLTRKDYPRAERMFRDVVRRYSETLSPTHLNTGIAEIKLGRALVRQKRYAEAEPYTLAGYNVLMKQTSPGVTWLKAARTDLTEIYEALKQPEKAAGFRVDQRP